ncbi:MAG: hypothetical protein K1X81_08295 [Bacteroidia bacterium]|nr:hypothetical protein [Bacteroidia bacterium]
MLPVHTRIAPTPSGYLHKGNAFNFLLASQLARQSAGTLRLRIDDLDTLRMQPEHMADIFESLHWLGIEWQLGPRTMHEQTTAYARHLRLPRYHEVINRLMHTEKVFACTCSRKEIREMHTHGRYPGTCRHKNIPLDYPGSSIRIQVPEHIAIRFTDELKGETAINLWETTGDFVIRRRDLLPAYHIASLTDDIDYGINTIVRGEDLAGSTAAQLYLATLLGEHSFLNARFYHHHLLLDENGHKLSKSGGSTSLKWMREHGVTPQEITGLLNFYTPALKFYRK